ncbi:MAG: hypothetical protein AMJ43_00685 [Coxiella sp. DG_40]|nr:MAG: hypothetical protein AMJ43_00685 [Coxiella sp. DG_40]
MIDSKTNSNESQNDLQPIDISKPQEAISIKPIRITKPAETIEIIIPKEPSLITDGYDPKLLTKTFKGIKK